MIACGKSLNISSKTRIGGKARVRDYVCQAVVIISSLVNCCKSV